MKLLHLEVSGFRGFSSKQKFDLRSDAIVVVGANGLGKTSLLDAIQWGLCGKLGRLGSGDDKILSLYSNTGQARVALTLQNETSEFLITRVFDGESQDVRVSTNGGEFKGSSAKAKIFEGLWPEAENAQDGEESLSLALTRSVYLQQDRLRNFLEGSDHHERFNVISELVGAGRLTELQSQLEKESRSWSKQTTKLRNDEVPLNERVSNLKKQLDQLAQATQLGEQLSETKWSDWWSKAKGFDDGINEIPTPTSADAGTRLDRSIRNLRAMRDQSRRKQSAAEQLNELLKNEPPKPAESVDDLNKQLTAASKAAENARNELKDAQEKAAEARQKQVAAKDVFEQRRALAQLALKLLEERCPVCDQDYDVEETRERLESLVAEKPTDRTDATIDVSDFANREKIAAKAEADLKRKVSEAVRLGKDVEAWNKDCNERFDELGVAKEKQNEQAIISLLDLLRAREEELQNLIDDGEKLSLNLARESAQAKLKFTEEDLKNARNELIGHQLAISKREVTSETIKLLIGQLREARSKVAIDKLSEIEPLLQRIFARIDPHPTFRAVKLATEFFRGKGRLDAEVRDTAEDKYTKSPETIFSSSQLNALAVSMFLSFNLALPHLPLQAAMLDDPIQSLDDINLLGLVDLLRRTKEHRQIIVSTHDARFGKLLARKLRPANDSQSTSVIELHGWKRTGPDVEQYQVKPDVIPLRLAAM